MLSGVKFASICLLLMFACGCIIDRGYYNQQKIVMDCRKTNAKCTAVVYPVDIGSSNYPVMSIMRFDMAWTLICGVWRDGRVIWSKDFNQGGPPFFAGNISTQAIAQTLCRLNQQGIYDEPLNYQIGALLDVVFVNLFVRDGDKILYMGKVDPSGEYKYTTNLERQVEQTWTMIYTTIQGLMPKEGVTTNYLYEIVGTRYYMAVPPGRVDGVVRLEPKVNPEEIRERPRSRE